MAMESYVLAGGCFWCLDAVYRTLKGVDDVVSGYTGGTAPNPSYEAVCTGATGHAEAVRVDFDPDVIPRETILDVFTRMDRALRIAVRRHPGETSVCVSHGDPIKILRIGYSGMDLNANRVRAPDPGQGSLVSFDFWHADALPIITAVDYAQLERIIKV